MAHGSAMRFGVVRAVQFAAVMAIVLWPVRGWAQSSISVEFAPTKEQKVEARSVPAKNTGEDESVLSLKGYFQIGTITAERPVKMVSLGPVPSSKADPDKTREMESAILQKAGDAGGDVVHFDIDGEVTTKKIDTGKKKIERTCEQSQTVTVSAGQDCVKSCFTDSAGHTNCTNASCSPKSNIVERCVRWGPPGEVSVMKEEKILRSTGSVWRYDPKLAPDLARAAEAAVEAPNAGRDAARKTVEGFGRAGDASRNPQAAEATGKNFQPLHDALESGKIDEAELLLAQGADANARDAMGRTHLHYAAMWGNKKAVELLLDHGADVNAKDNTGGTPLIMAMGYAGQGVVELLLDHGADVNSRNAVTFTPLHMAAMEGRKDLAELLLAHGADVNAKAGNGITPLKIAVLGAHQDVADVLRQHGGHK